MDAPPAPPAPPRRRRILIAKPGLDGHDRGAKIIVRALVEAGYEVIYIGLHQEPAAIVRAALQEDAEAVGLSILSGAHMTLFPAVLAGLKSNGNVRRAPGLRRAASFHSATSMHSKP